MFLWRLRPVLIGALVTACSDGAAATDGGSSTSAETLATTAANNTDWTGDVTTTVPTTTADPTSTTTSTSEVDTTTGEELVCIMAAGTDTSGEPASWTYSYGVPSESIVPNQLVVAPDGSITTALPFKGEIDLGAGVVETHGDKYRFLTRYSAAGEFTWSSHIATAMADSGYSSELESLVMAVDCAGNVVVAGGFTGKIAIQGKTLTAVPGKTFYADIIYDTDDIFLIKFGPDGLRRWARRFGDDRQQRIHSVGVQADGTIIVGGASNGTLELDGSSNTTLNGEPTAGNKYVGLLAAFDPDGLLVWKRTYTSAYDVALINLAIAADDRIFAYGYAGGDTDFGGGPVQITDDPNFIAQFEPDGAHRWSTRFFDTKHQPYGIGADMAGGVVFSGSLGANAFVARYDESGELAWNHDLIRKDHMDILSFSIGPLIVDNEVIIGGGLPEGSLDFGGGPLVTPPDQQHPFLARYDLAGTHLASATYDDASWAPFISGDRGPDGELALVGYFRDTLDLGDGPRMAVGQLDLFIHRAIP